MTCGEVRELLFAFLDNELDAALSIDVQRHLEHCPECAREAETERTIQKRLAAVMDRDSSNSQELEELLSAALASTSPSPGRRRRRTRTWLSITVGVAAMIALGFFTHRWVGLTSSSPLPNSLVNLLIADFDHFLSEGRPVQIASADRKEVSQWLLGKTGLAVSLPTTTQVNCKLIGGRKCTLNGQPAAFASYEMDSKPTSLVVLTGGRDAIDNLERVSRDGHTFWVDRSKGYSLVACVRNDLIYAAVSRADNVDLIRFMSELE